MLQSGNGWAHVTSMSWAQKTITASESKKPINYDCLYRWCVDVYKQPENNLISVRPRNFYWIRSGKCSSLSDPTQGTTLALYPVISTSTPVLTNWISSIVRDHVRDFEPLLQEDCVDLTAGSVNAVAESNISQLGSAWGSRRVPLSAVRKTNWHLFWLHLSHRRLLSKLRSFWKKWMFPSPTEVLGRHGFVTYSPCT